MKEQTVPMTLNTDEDLQCRWKYTIGVACSIAKLVDIFTEFYKAVYEAFKKVAETIYETFNGLKDIFEDLNNEYKKRLSQELSELSCKSVKRRPPKCLGNYRINTKGFTSPIIKCVRSRC